MSETASATRKHIYLIVDHPGEDTVGKLEVTDTRHPGSSKNEQTVVDKRNMNTGETWTQTVVSAGYIDYESEEEYEEQIADDTSEKLAEIDRRHLEDAGLDPDEVFD